MSNLFGASTVLFGRRGREPDEGGTACPFLSWLARNPRTPLEGHPVQEDWKVVRILHPVALHGHRLERAINHALENQGLKAVARWESGPYLPGEERPFEILVMDHGALFVVDDDWPFQWQGRLDQPIRCGVGQLAAHRLEGERNLCQAVCSRLGNGEGENGQAQNPNRTTRTFRSEQELLAHFAAGFRHGFMDATRGEQAFFEFKNHFYGPLMGWLHLVGATAKALPAALKEPSKTALGRLEIELDDLYLHLMSLFPGSPVSGALLLEGFTHLKELRELTESDQVEPVVARQALFALGRLDQVLTQLAAPPEPDAAENNWPTKVLVVDDHVQRWAPLWQQLGWQVHQAHPETFISQDRGRLSSGQFKAWLASHYKPEDLDVPPPPLLLDLVYSTAPIGRLKRYPFSGRDLLEHARRTYPELPVVLTTVVDDPSTGLRLGGYLGQDWHVKGSDPRQLRACLTQMLRECWPFLELHQRISRLLSSGSGPKIKRLREAALEASAGNWNSVIVLALLAYSDKKVKGATNWCNTYLRGMRNAVCHDRKTPFVSARREDAEISLRLAVGHHEMQILGQVCSPHWVSTFCEARCTAAQNMFISARPKEELCSPDGRITLPKKVNGKRGPTMTASVYLEWLHDATDPYGPDSNDERLRSIVLATCLEQFVAWKHLSQAQEFFQ